MKNAHGARVMSRRREVAHGTTERWAPPLTYSKCLMQSDLIFNWNRLILIGHLKLQWGLSPIGAFLTLASFPRALPFPLVAYVPRVRSDNTVPTAICHKCQRHLWLWPPYSSTDRHPQFRLSSTSALWPPACSVRSPFSFPVARAVFHFALCMFSSLLYSQVRRLRDDVAFFKRRQPTQPPYLWYVLCPTAFCR